MTERFTVSPAVARDVEAIVADLPECEGRDVDVFGVRGSVMARDLFRWSLHCATIRIGDAIAAIAGLIERPGEEWGHLWLIYSNHGAHRHATLAAATKEIVLPQMLARRARLEVSVFEGDQSLIRFWLDLGFRRDGSFTAGTSDASFQKLTLSKGER